MANFTIVRDARDSPSNRGHLGDSSSCSDQPLTIRYRPEREALSLGSPEDERLLSGPLDDRAGHA
jgi:hypothetical protein